MTDPNTTTNLEELIPLPDTEPFRAVVAQFSKTMQAVVDSGVPLQAVVMAGLYAMGAGAFQSGLRMRPLARVGRDLRAFQNGYDSANYGAVASVVPPVAAVAVAAPALAPGVAVAQPPNPVATAPASAAEPPPLMPSESLLTLHRPKHLH